ncbi:MAG: zinc ribbon domain-containing protein [Lentisphaeria bacterium]|jgi:hypothetical protein|nr:zinc ribbon domain-containing protein [Lentisphaeria bacterium]
MPTYDYHCEANDQTIEVRHGMAATLSTWGELCATAGIESGDTAPETPIKRMISGGILNIAKRTDSPAPPPPAGGHCCGGGCQH